VETAGQLLVTAGDNPDRLHSDALAALCGASPVEASSGKTTRHRLNRGGDRQANNALWVIALTRLRDTPAPAPTLNSAPPGVRRPRTSCAASSATSPESCFLCSKPISTTPNSSTKRGVELAILAGESLHDIIAAVERGIQRIRHTHHLAYSFLRSCGLSLW
jgi:hypothetical protein